MQEEDSEHEGTFENKEDKMAGRCDITIPVFNGEDYTYVEKTNNDVSEIQEVWWSN